MEKKPLLKYYCGIVFFVIFSQSSFAQIQKRDTLYSKIEHFAKKKSYTKFLYNLVFRETPDTVSISNIKTEANHEMYRDKYIRNIDISVIDPFGREADFKKTKTTSLQDFGNHLHMETKKNIIKNYLFFKKGERLDPQKLQESERILRAQNFINRVQIIPIDSTSTSDSIDVAVNILDAWSFLPRFSINKNSFSLGVTEENVFGYGHELSFDYGHNFRDRTNLFSGGYLINNIRHSFINASVSFLKDYNKNENYQFLVKRDFISPLTKWAGEISLNYFIKQISVPTSIQNRVFNDSFIRVLNQNVWAGYQFSVFKKAGKDNYENLVLQTRFQNYRYLEQPDESINPNNFFTSYQTILTTFGYTSRKFASMHSVFQYNYLEDIPYGKEFSITSGYLKQEGRNLPYLGMTAGYGNFIGKTYLNFLFQYGSFFREQKGYRSIFRFDGTFFTPLLNWKFATVRHFFSPTIVLGNRKHLTYDNKVNLNSSNEFPTYNENYFGSDKLLFRYQFQMFIDKKWKNFHFSPYFTTTLGLLSLDNSDLFKNKLNTKFGIGVLINNPYLTFSRFQISFVFYPSVPFDGKNDFLFNSINTTDIPINSFNLDLPNILNYNN